MLYMKMAFLASLFFMSPFVFLQLWYFIAPGLYRKEKKYVIPFVLMTTFFFSLGAAVRLSSSSSPGPAASS